MSFGVNQTSVIFGLKNQRGPQKKVVKNLKYISRPNGSVFGRLENENNELWFILR